MQSTINENLGLLRSCETLLNSIAPGEYTRPSPVCFNSAIGEHFRHVLDHYLMFLGGVESDSRIDYEARERDPRIERDPLFARGVVRDVAARLGRLGGPKSAEHVSVKLEGAENGNEWADSSPARELVFLVSHTVHHCALISVICGANGLKVPADFGVAPSTLRYRAGKAATCAR